ncbi:MAG: DNA recombination protein RmuC [Bacteroidales bacterium]|nr:DNA recombination protein RmuC [Bacteroidales bacterium]
MTYIYLLIGLAFGGLSAFLLSKISNQNKIKAFDQKINNLEKDYNQKINELDKEKIVLNERLKNVNSENEKYKTELIKEREENQRLNINLAKANSEKLNIQEKLETQKKEIEELQKKFQLEFENIANKILKENSKEFTATNQKNIGEILDPLKDKIKSFEEKIQKTYEKGLKDQVDLKAELKNLHELNTKISQDANNLTNALKYDSKKQGNWGEIVLERILERSGLVKDEEYSTQETSRDDRGKIYKPDVIIKLPDNKHIIIDSKVSLTAYESFINSDENPEKDKFLKQHIDSIKRHINELSEKKYQDLYNIDSPDFVLLFIPIESSFSLAVKSDINLFNLAWDKKIVIVSPTTLLATLRTVASIWKHEKQTQNALEIARQSGKLYDKFVGLLADLQDVGKHINKANESFVLTQKKLSTGKDNLITKVERIKKLGAKTTKTIPNTFIQENLELNS